MTRRSDAASENLIDLSEFSVRDGRLAPITCVRCGCRLQRRSGAGDTWWHFAGSSGRDARGCLIACAERPHYSAGIAFEAAG
jgi:hypothetical protein